MNILSDLFDIMDHLLLSFMKTISNAIFYISILYEKITS